MTSWGAEAADTVSTFSVSCRTGRPYRPCTTRPASHHAGRAQRGDRDASRRPGRVARPVCSELGGEHDRGCDEHEDQRRGVDRPGSRCDQGERNGCPPASFGDRPAGEHDQPRQRRPRQEQGGESSGERQLVRSELVEQGGHERRSGRGTEMPAQPEHPEAGRGGDAGEPEALGHPHRQADGVRDPEPGSHRPQEPEVLVRDGSRRERRVPETDGSMTGMLRDRCRGTGGCRRTPSRGRMPGNRRARRRRGRSGG